MDIRLGDGSDTVILSTAAAQAIVDAGPGDDVIDTGGDDVNATGGAAQVEVLGGPGNDTLTVRSHSDIMRGNEGNDVFNEPCGDSPPRVDGGLGTDTVSFACSPVGATIDLRHSPRLANLEHVVGSPQADVITCPDRPCTVDAGAGDDTIHGSAHADVLDGGPGDDTIYGGAGNDALTGGPDVDTIYGGPGDDRIDDPNEDGKHFGGPGNDTITAGGALAGGPGDDRLLCTGWPGGNGFTVEESCKLSDGPGDDYVRGADTTGVPPNLGDGDFLVAGPGSDTYDLRRGPDAGTAFYCQVVGPTCGLDIRFRPDTVSYAARGRPVFASVDGKPNDGVKDEHDNIVSAAEIVGGRAGDVLAGSPNRGSTLLGGPGADRLRGGAGNDLLYGGPGADLLIGGGGADQIDGGGGVDTFRCGAGKDQVGDRKRTERAEGCETFAPLPTYPVV
jgi:Ca2+-binding RTX toxin-like protein